MFGYDTYGLLIVKHLKEIGNESILPKMEDIQNFLISEIALLSLILLVLIYIVVIGAMILRTVRKWNRIFHSWNDRLMQ